VCYANYVKLTSIDNPIAYFCTEFAIDNELPTYSGGLGILAGDVMHEAALQHFPMVGIGLLYKGKEFMQHITGDGKAETRDSEFDHDTSFLRPTTVDGIPLLLNLKLGSVEVKIKAYHLRLSDKTILFFLSSDVDGNPPEWISDMDTLYHGDEDSQIRQQILLGVGGVKLLTELNINPSYYHINEGRPSFCAWEIAGALMKEKKLSFEEAWQKVKEKIIYTNHTLVTAGNPTYRIALIERWATPFAENLGIDTNFLIRDGFTDPGTFSITQFALNISAKQTSVSKVHGDYSKKQYPDYDWISITNGVHLHRWQDSDFRNQQISDRQLWDLHMTKKRELAETVIKRTGIGYDPERLVITWSRRLAEYKQPKIIFEDLERLKKMLSKPDMPVQLLFAGNTHSADPNAKAIIEEIIQIFGSDLSG
jgi:glycogen phosphorylase